MKLRSLALLLALLIEAGLCCLPASALAEVRIVTTLPSFADIARNVGGDEVTVLSLTQGGQDPHFVSNRPDKTRDPCHADLLLRAGLGLEDAWLPQLLVKGGAACKVRSGTDRELDVSTVVKVVGAPKGSPQPTQGDVHPSGNPHYMSDPRNGILLAEAIAERLGKIESGKAAYFKQNAEKYASQLKARIVLWDEKLKPLAGTSVVAYHESWPGLETWARLKELGSLEPRPGLPPTPQHLVELIKAMKRGGAKLILLEPYSPSGVARNVARQTGASIVVLPAEVVTTYIGFFDDLVARILKGLAVAAMPSPSVSPTMQASPSVQASPKPAKRSHHRQI